jgi:phosphoglycolate phosphatase-like HAD superfamily hydrolase
MGQVQVPLRWLLVLWDIDHTLIENNGVNKEIYAEAFELLTGRRAEHRAETDGRTEPEIMRNMLVAHDIEPPSDYLGRVTEALEAATSDSASRLRDRGHELPGARVVLAEFRGISGIIQSVLSGNIRANAYTKLSTFGLHEYLDFEVGGYGSDDDVRASLVGVAQRRASAKYGVTFTPDITVLVGDTLRDVRAGMEGGARVVGVASGPDSMDALQREGADAVLPDLRDTAAVVRAVTQFRGQVARGVLPG